MDTVTSHNSHRTQHSIRLLVYSAAVQVNQFMMIGMAGSLWTNYKLAKIKIATYKSKLR